jgi:FKBP-type peptidyl-prolyl cis-trans isomerase SlyD
MIKKGDFIEMDFVAKLKSSGQIFDTTMEKVAKENHIHHDHSVYKPYIFCVGESQILKGIDDFVAGKEPGKYSVELSPELAFGKKNAKLLRLVSRSEFHKHKIEPMPGLEIELDGQRGVVRTVNGGRVIVDFNHPLASQEVIYEVTIHKIVTDGKAKVEAVLNGFKIPFKSVELNDGKANIAMPGELPAEMTQPLATEISRLTGVKDIMFSK